MIYFGKWCSILAFVAFIWLFTTYCLGTYIPSPWFIGFLLLHSAYTEAVHIRQYLKLQKEVTNDRSSKSNN